MPLIPKGLGGGFIDRVKTRLKRELGLEPAAPKREGPPGGYYEIELRIRRAVRQDPPKLLHALYQAQDAKVPTWRHIAPYSVRDRGANGGPLIFAACEKEGWKIEAFVPSRFKDLQVTQTPWPPAAYKPHPIEFRDGD